MKAPRGKNLPVPLWRRRHRAMVWLLWAHAALVPVVGIVYGGHGIGHAPLHAAPIAAFAILKSLPLSRRAGSVIAAAGLLTASAMLVHATNGLTEAHFHFFFVLAILTLYEDWAPYALAFVYVGVHHGVLGMLAPDHVFGHDGDAWAWAIVHTAFIGAAGFANVTSWRMNEAVRAHADAQSRGRERAEAVARTLRESLMPAPLPDLAEARVAARYSTGDGDVGGDWFEVLELPDGRIGVGLGDVAGRGVSAAGLTAKLRNTLRAHAGEGMSPAEILRRLDRNTEGSFATVVYAIVDPAAETVRISSAGHPAPLLVAPDGSAGFVDRVQGPPLAGFGTPFPETELDFPAGSTLVLYTDGLFERRDERIDASLARLREHADGLTEPPEGLCSRLFFSMRPEHPVDDVALVALQTTSPAAYTTVTVPAQPEHVTALRRSATRWARAVGVEDVHGVTLAVGEAAANAVEHSGSETVELHMRTDGDWAEVIVRDFGAWSQGDGHDHADPATNALDGDLEAALLAPSGRGLSLMAACTEVTVGTRGDGTDVTLRVRRDAAVAARPAPAVAEAA